MSKQVVNYSKQHKALAISAIVAIVAIIISLIVTINLTNNKNKQEENNENELKELLKELGSKYYEEFYYVLAGKDDKSRKEFISKYNETGITTTLDNISKSVNDIEDKISEFKNSKTEETCDKEKTIVKIIPKEPYGVKDYELEVALICGF